MNILASLSAAFTNLASILHGDLSLVDVWSNDSGVNLTLSKEVCCRGDWESEAYSIHLQWEELTDHTLDISAMAQARWQVSKEADDLERETHRREQAAEEAAKERRRKAARKRTRTKRELATLARLAARHNVTLS